MHSPEMSSALKKLERLVNQNAEDEIYSDYRYWEDASDAFRDNLGTCLPLWKFEDVRTKVEKGRVKGMIHCALVAHNRATRNASSELGLHRLRQPVHL